MTKTLNHLFSIKLCYGKDFGIWEEVNGSAVLIALTHFLNFCLWDSPYILLHVHIPVFAYLYSQIFRKSIYHRNSHTVETTRHFICFPSKLPSSVKGREHSLKSRFLCLFVDIYWDTPTIIFHGSTPIFMKTHLNTLGFPSHNLINSVIKYLPKKMVQSPSLGRTDIHTRPFPYWIKALKYLNIFSCVIAFLDFLVCHNKKLDPLLRCFNSTNLGPQKQAYGLLFFGLNTGLNKNLHL